MALSLALQFIVGHQNAGTETLVQTGAYPGGDIGAAALLCNLRSLNLPQALKA